MSENSVGRMGVPPVHSCSARGGQAYPFWWPSALGGHLLSGVQASPSRPLVPPPHLTLYPAGLPGGGSQLKWIFRDPAALALGFCGAPRSPRGDESDVRVWLLKFLSRSSVVGKAVGSDTLLRGAGTHPHHQRASDTQLNTQGSFPAGLN